MGNRYRLMRCRRKTLSRSYHLPKRKAYKLLVGLLIVVGFFMTADPAQARVVARFTVGHVEADSGGCYTMSKHRFTNSDERNLRGFGSISTINGGSSVKGDKASARASLSASSIENGIRITGSSSGFVNNVEGKTDDINDFRLWVGSSVNFSNFYLEMDVSKPSHIRLEIEGQASLNIDGKNGKGKWFLAADTIDPRTGKWIPIFSDEVRCNDLELPCTKNKNYTKKFSLDVVSGQRINFQFGGETDDGNIKCERITINYTNTFSWDATFTVRAIEEGGCSGLKVKAFEDVLPINSGINGNTYTTITASVSNPAPAGGCEVTFDPPKPVVYSGGHQHDDKTRPHGTFDKTSCIIQEGTTFCTVKYSSSEVSGEEKIKAKLTSTREEAEGIVKVKVSGLLPLETKPNLLPWGQTDKHTAGNNNYGTTYTRDAVYFAVSEYAKEYFNLNLDPDIRLTVMDMSLPWGGLFDIDGNWKPPHSLHRIGRSVDFSKHYKAGNGNNLEVTFFDEDGNVAKVTEIINDKKLDKYFEKRNCTRLEKKIGKIHYECTK